MIRRPRATKPHKEAKELADILHPLPVYAWSNLAMDYLGVPIIVPQFSLVVQDENYDACKEKLIRAGYPTTTVDRRLRPEILARLPNPEEVMAQVMAAYASFDQAATLFKYPYGGAQIALIPISFACIEPDGDFDVYSNIHYPLEKTLAESFIRCLLLEDNPGTSIWGLSLNSSVGTMNRYLEIENDLLDSCKDEKAVQWFSEYFGRQHEEKYGPRDLRISKRIGSGRELPVNSRGKPVTTG